MLKKLLLVAAPLLLAACGGGSPFTYHMEGVSRATLEEDREECGTAAREADPNVPNQYIDYSQGSAHVAGASFASGFARGMEEGKLKREVYEACFAKKGYSKTWLTEEELAEFRTAKKESKEGAMDYLYAIGTEPRSEDRFVKPD